MVVRKKYRIQRKLTASAVPAAASTDESSPPTTSEGILTNVATYCTVVPYLELGDNYIQLDGASSRLFPFYVTYKCIFSNCELSC